MNSELLDDDNDEEEEKMEFEDIDDETELDDIMELESVLWRDLNRRRPTLVTLEVILGLLTGSFGVFND